MERRTVFGGWLLPMLLVLPQLLLTGFFFYWPAGQAVWSSLERDRLRLTSTSGDHALKQRLRP